MRKLLYSAISLAAVAVLVTPALAQPYHRDYRYYRAYGHAPYHRAYAYAPAYRAYAYAPAYRDENRARVVAPVAGVVAGTVFGLGISEGWWGATIGEVALPATTAGAAALGGVAGMGTVALVDAALQPCRGFAAMFGFNHDACVNGRYVGYAPRPPVR